MQLTCSPGWEQKSEGQGPVQDGQPSRQDQRVLRRIPNLHICVSWCVCCTSTALAFTPPLLTLASTDVCGTDKLYTKDPKIMYAVLNDIHTFVAEPVIQEMMRLVSGGGIISAFGEEHRRMRKIVSPSFATGNLRAMLPTVTKHTAALCEQLDTLLERGGGGKWKGAVNVASLLDFTALSVIAEAGFGYNVDEQSSSVDSDSSNALLDDRVAQNELARTYSETVQAALQGGLQMVILMAAARGKSLIHVSPTIR